MPLTDYQLSMRLLGRLSQKLSRQFGCQLHHDAAIRFPAIPNLTIVTVPDLDGLERFHVSYLDRHQRLTCELFDPDLDTDPLEFTKLLSFLGACALSSSAGKP